MRTVVIVTIDIWKGETSKMELVILSAIMHDSIRELEHRSQIKYNYLCRSLAICTYKDA